MFKVSILTIGDEICIGQIVNTNAVWISEQCSNLGAFITEHISVHDDEEHILDALDRLKLSSDYVIITGGLGPTEDDITKEVLCKYFDDELTLHKDTLEYLTEFFKLRNREFTKFNQVTAYLPKKCMIWRNRIGTAPGMKFMKDNVSFVSLPGVPTEMKYLMENYVLPDITQNISDLKSDIVLYRTIHTLGQSESALAESIGSLESIFEGSIAYLPSYRGVRLRLSAYSNNRDHANMEIDKAVNYINSKVSDFIISVDNESLDWVINKELNKLNKTVAVAESCTGGLLGGLFTNTPGSSSYFLGGIISYSNDIKINILGVNKATIETFGAVSEETAIEMARNIRRKFNSDYGISITGIAGPDGGTEEKPVGTVWIGLSNKDNTSAIRYVFGSGRSKNRELAVSSAVYNLLEQLK